MSRTQRYIIAEQEYLDYRNIVRERKHIWMAARLTQRYYRIMERIAYNG